MAETNIYCYSRLQPRGGLGNKLFVWAYGLVFSDRNNCPHYISNWSVIHFGPLLRGQKSLRLYFGSFNNMPFWRKRALKTALSKAKKVDLLANDIALKPEYIKEPTLFRFYKVSDEWHTAYDDIKPYRSLIIDNLDSVIKKRVYKKLKTHKIPFIGVHIRKGDFKPLKENASLETSSIAQQTPNQYFVDTINQLRAYLGKDVSVTIFSDGRPSELKELLALKNVAMVREDLDIVHMLLLSQSEIIILSEGSTFGGWSAFLGDGLIIRNSAMFRNTIRPDRDNKKVYEGVLPAHEEEYPLLLHQSLKSLLASYE